MVSDAHAFLTGEEQRNLELLWYQSVQPRAGLLVSVGRVRTDTTTRCAALVQH